MPFDERARSRYRSNMRRRIVELRAQCERSLDCAIDRMMLASSENYIKVEKGLEEIDRMVTLIEAELIEIRELVHARRLEARLEFIEDRFEDFDSEIYQRPKRRRRKINLFAFFQRATGGGDPMAAQGEIGSQEEAYRALGLEYGSSMAAVTRAFRQKAKTLHPDINHGDRSAEPALRRVIEAYQLLRSDSTIPRTEAHGTEGR